ncbi:hypothetical protein IE53DRAFT_366156 [Violaceomyces palustris]|uniref:Uncharacterized protein n=1 Tax=Violaceomyces palustris TaxID=1673888 RepID=A0ACD0P6A4_9BASI|nr:hypothetical protein IE53DRAFT_366156 [Violaceomyces palustris]
MATSASASASSSTPSPLSTSAFPLLPPEDRHDHPPPPSLDSTDPRVHLDQQSSKWRYEDDQGQEWEWQELPPHHRPSHLVPKDHHQSEPLATQTTPPGHWVKLIDENLFQAQQAAYSVQGVDQEVRIPHPPQILPSKRSSHPSARDR